MLSLLSAFTYAKSGVKLKFPHPKFEEKGCGREKDDICTFAFSYCFVEVFAFCVSELFPPTPLFQNVCAIFFCFLLSVSILLQEMLFPIEYRHFIFIKLLLILFDTH